MPDAFLVDAGNFLFSMNRLSTRPISVPENASPGARKFFQLIASASKQHANNPAGPRLEAARMVMDFYRDMGYEVIGAGMKDFAAGVKFLKDETAKRGLHLVSSNIMKDGKPLFEPFRVVEKNGVKVGFAAVTSCMVKRYGGEELSDCVPGPKAMARVVPELRKKCDFVVVLSDAGDVQNRKMVDSVPGIDLVIKSGQGRRLYKPQWYGKVPAVMTHPKGKAVGVVKLEKSGEGQVKVFNNLVLLDKKIPMDAAAKARVEAFVKKQREAQKAASRPHATPQSHSRKVPFPFGAAPASKPAATPASSH